MKDNTMVLRKLLVSQPWRERDWSRSIPSPRQQWPTIKLTLSSSAARWWTNREEVEGSITLQRCHMQSWQRLSTLASQTSKIWSIQSAVYRERSKFWPRTNSSRTSSSTRSSSGCPTWANERSLSIWASSGPTSCVRRSGKNLRNSLSKAKKITSTKSRKSKIVSISFERRSTRSSFATIIRL